MSSSGAPMHPWFPRFGEVLPRHLVLTCALALSTGCDDSRAEADGGADAGTDAGLDAGGGTDAGGDAGVDGGEPDRIGMAGRSGSATATEDGYAGTEEVFFLGDEGNGEAVCRIGYSLTSTGAAADGCEGCLWAFSLVVADAHVIEERDVGCLATVGIDPAQVGDLDGTQAFYGYHPAYMGHGDVLMSRTEDGAWAPECFASWDEGSGAFSYERIDGFPPY